MDADLFPGGDPETAAAMRQEPGITEDDYTAIAPDPPEREGATIRARLRELVGGVRNGYVKTVLKN